MTVEENPLIHISVVDKQGSCNKEIKIRILRSITYIKQEKNMNKLDKEISSQDRKLEKRDLEIYHA